MARALAKQVQEAQKDKANNISILLAHIVLRVHFVQCCYRLVESCHQVRTGDPSETFLGHIWCGHDSEYKWTHAGSGGQPGRHIYDVWKDEFSSLLLPILKTAKWAIKDDPAFERELQTVFAAVKELRVAIAVGEKLMSADIHLALIVSGHRFGEGMECADREDFQGSSTFQRSRKGPLSISPSGIHHAFGTVELGLRLAQKTGIIYGRAFYETVLPPKVVLDQTVWGALTPSRPGFEQRPLDRGSHEMTNFI